MFKYPIDIKHKNIKISKFVNHWSRFWMRYAGLKRPGRIAMRLAAIFINQDIEQLIRLSFLNEKGFIDHSAIINHPKFILGKHCFIGDRVIIRERENGGSIQLGNNVGINRDTIIETGAGGCVYIDDFASIHPNCHIFSYLQPIRIGKGVMVAAACAMFSYNHGIALQQLIRQQPLESKGPIVIGDEAWIGAHVKILQNVTIGNGAIIGAGSTVLSDIPENAVAAGVPAKVIGFRKNNYESFKNE